MMPFLEIIDDGKKFFIMNLVFNRGKREWHLMQNKKHPSLIQNVLQYQHE
jgi:hypothetical protein